MAKNFASIYAGGNDSSALNQSFFVKAQVARGSGVVPAGTDFLYSLSGGSINFSQTKISSPHRSGRHNNNIIKEKKAVEWSLPTYLNIKQGVAYTAAIDSAIKVLWKSLLGRETDTTAAYKYDAVNDPSIYFTMFENLDHMAKQAIDCFVMQGELSLPGDGQAQVNWTGNASNVVHAGIGKSLTANIANTITLAVPSEASRFDVGSYVMIVESNGTTRSADTTTGSARQVVSSDKVTGEVVLSGAVLADADGTVNPIYLCYYEPTSITGIDEPQTGLVGSISVDGFGGLTCVRSATLTIANNHEIINYCYGIDHPVGFIPGSRLEASISMEMNLNAQLVESFAQVREFTAQEIALIVGDIAGRYFQVDLPRVIFDVPAITIPESGSVPVSFEGTCLQTAYDMADEVTVSYK